MPIGVGSIVGVIGGSIGVITSLVNLAMIWRGRAKLDFKVLRTKYLVIPYSEWEIERVKESGHKPHPGWEPFVKAGDIHRAFSVIEFSIKNNYSHDVTLGRMDIDGWMFSDHFTRPMYGPKNDYRVYDLHTRQKVSLAEYVKLAPRASLGRRVEILEEAEGPGWISSHTRYSVDKRDQFVITINSDVGVLTRSIPVRMEVEEYHAFRVSHWGDLLPPFEYDSAGAPPP